MSSAGASIPPQMLAARKRRPSRDDSDGVRQRVWAVLCEWFSHTQGGSVVMTWPSKQEPGGQGLLTLGLPKRELVAHDNMVLVRWPPPPPTEPPASAPT